MISDSAFWAVDRCEGAADVVVSFSAVNTRPGSFMMRRILANFPAQRIYLNCPGNQWYLDGVPGLGDSPQTMAESLSALIDGLRGPGGRVLFFGGSMGGYGAMDYGLRCEADLIFAAGAELLLNLPGGISRGHLNGRAADQPIIARLRDSGSVILLVYGEDFSSDLYCGAAALPFLNTKSKIVTFAARNHNVTPFLARRYDYRVLFRGLLQGRNLAFSSDDTGDLMQRPELVRAIYAAHVPDALSQFPDLPDPEPLLHEALQASGLTSGQRSAAAHALGKLYLREQQPVKALAAAEAGIAASDRSPRLRNLAARAARRCGQGDAARRHLDRMIALSLPDLGTNDPGVLQSLLRLCLDLGEISSGLSLAQRHLPTEPNDPRLWKLYETLLTRHLAQVRQDPAAARAVLAAMQAH